MDKKGARPYTEKELESKVDKIYYHMIASKGIDKDRRYSKAYFASDVLNNSIKFILMPQESYWRLEEIWLREVKDVIAYFYWKNLGKDKGEISDDPKIYYHEACHFVNDLLKDRKSSEKKEEFEKVKDYLKKNYLNKRGKLLHPEKNSVLEKSLKSKAKRIFKIMGSTDKKVNWKTAEAYMKYFYENIIPAVEDNKRECIELVLKAFQFSKQGGLAIINSFETVIIVKFVYPEQQIRKLWEEFAF